MRYDPTRWGLDVELWAHWARVPMRMAPDDRMDRANAPIVVMSELHTPGVGC